MKQGGDEVPRATTNSEIQEAGNTIERSYAAGLPLWSSNPGSHFSVKKPTPAMGANA